MWFRSHSLYILLPTFILIGILAMVREVSLSNHKYYQGEGLIAGTRAHRPAEFPTAFAFNPLEGLPPTDPNAARPAAARSGEPTAGDYHVPNPPITPDYWPCSQCHDKDSNNATRRVLKEEHRKILLNHGENRWCLDCHDFDDRDKLRLASGEKIPFEESYRLCGQCHGDKYRDWKLGIHGKRTGYWNGPKRYLLCVNCHWPHAPHFKSLQPLPPPVRPEFLRVPKGETPPPDAPPSPRNKVDDPYPVPVMEPSGVASPAPAASATAAPSDATASPSPATSAPGAPSSAASDAPGGKDASGSPAAKAATSPQEAK